MRIRNVAEVRSIILNNLSLPLVRAYYLSMSQRRS